ncbi:galactokinase, partial [Lachnospiraceae bacterium OttesenSCG-928-D06]|nr:galactokinase [Lachnospiraceae bacterium OttesenSCG-928-D06]
MRLTTENRMELEKIYGKRRVEENWKRYQEVTLEFKKRYGSDKDCFYFSAPGRTEIGGNHTDHNAGLVLAASINLDFVAAAAPNQSQYVNIVSKGYEQTIQIDLEELRCDGSYQGTQELVKGILDGFLQFGYEMGGFDAYVSSNVISSAGVSSSASLEMLICCMVNTFFNNGTVPIEVYAKIGQHGENKYWRKKSGMLDQLSCAVGGTVFIDFANQTFPIIKKLDFVFSHMGCRLMIVNTGKGHGDLSEEYSSIPEEMAKVARIFGKQYLREVPYEEVLQNICKIRNIVGDRALLRTIHYYEDNRRVQAQVQAIEKGNYEEMLMLINESGNSSWKGLQNCILRENILEQPIALSLTLTELFIKKIGKGACRVHGGGFAGVIMAVIPEEYCDEYLNY